MNWTEERITLAEYNRLGPFRQGYVSYMQGAWDGAEIPDGCPYEVDSTDGEQWLRGNYQAMIETQDDG